MAACFEVQVLDSHGCVVGAVGWSGWKNSRSPWSIVPPNEGHCFPSRREAQRAINVFRDQPEFTNLGLGFDIYDIEPDDVELEALAV